MPVPNCFALNSLALDLLAFLKTQKGKVREDAEAALTWLDSITSNAVGSVVIQNTGERRLCVSPPATAPNPVVFVVLKSRNITHIPGPNKARNNAANMLRMIFK